MKKGKISDIYLSVQGEGPYAWRKQLFLRFFGCNLGCVFCDTKLKNHKTYTPDSLIQRILEFKSNYTDLTLTGGEPLLQAEFLKDFLQIYKSILGKAVYLETNGVLTDELSGVIDLVDIIAMDFKLPSSTGLGSFWTEHEKFLRAAGSKNIFVKAVVTSNTSIFDICKMAMIIAKFNPDIITVLQPATPIGGIEPPDAEILFNFWQESIKTLKDVRIISQLHVSIGVK